MCRKLKIHYDLNNLDNVKRRPKLSKLNSRIPLEAQQIPV